MFTYCNPVELLTGAGALASLKTRVGGRPYVLLTHANPLFANTAAAVEDAIGHAPLERITEVADNPDLANLQQLCLQLSGLTPLPSLLVALGGGSVIDACKVLSATRGDFERLAPLIRGEDVPEAAIPYIAIPTTAGTGSEVTSWATVWDRDNGRKHSLAHPALYAQSAILDPALTLSLPIALTVSTALDALSHAFESLWNRNRNPVSSLFAIAAARCIVDTLPALIKSPASLPLRETLQYASLYAGLAFSNTQTSLAHNISYAITLTRGVSHGIACSFTLPMLVRACETQEELRVPIEQILGVSGEAAAVRLEVFFAAVGVAVDPRRYGYGEDEWLALLRDAAQGQRGRNFSGDASRLQTLYQNYFNKEENFVCQK